MPLRGIKICFTLLLLSLMLCLKAQQKPQYTQYILNNYLLNPAIGGIENYTVLNIGQRQQWKDLADAPQTTFLTAHWALGNQYLWDNPLTQESTDPDPRNNNYQQNYNSSPTHHGVGAAMVIDKAGQLYTSLFNISYAYHLQLGGMMNLSTGVALGITRTSIDVNALQLEDPNDPVLKNAAESIIKPDVAAGVWLYGARFFAGAAIQQLWPKKIAFIQDYAYQNGKQVPHVFLTAGYKFYAVEELSFIPSVLGKWINQAPLSIDVNLKLNYKDKVWIGVGYRKNDSFNAMTGFAIGNLLNFTYAYDFTTSQLNQVSSGSHELMLGILLNNVYKVVCPQKMW